MSVTLLAQPGRSYPIGIVEYLTVRNPGGSETRFQYSFGDAIAEKTAGPGQTITFPTGSGELPVTFLNHGPDPLLVQIHNVIRAEHLPSQAS